MRYKKALVTGGGGFIGSHLSKALLESGLEVIILDNLSMGRKENIPEGAIFIEGDILNVNDVKEAMSGVDIIFHEAAKVSVRSSIGGFYDDADTNIMGTINLLRVCAQSKVKKFVFASSMAVYGDSPKPHPVSENYTLDPLSPYGIGKLASEKYCLNICEQLGMNAVILRYFNTYGAKQTLTPYVGVITIFINKLLAGESPVVFGDGGQVRDFVYVGDIVEANLRAMEYEGGNDIFNIGSGIGHSVSDIANLLSSKINSEVPILYAEEQVGEIKNSIADISKASMLLNYSPRGVLDIQIDEVISWYSSK